MLGSIVGEEQYAVGLLAEKVNQGAVALLIGYKSCRYTRFLECVDDTFALIYRIAEIAGVEG